MSNLEELVPKYYEQKQTFDSLKKEVDNLNKEIKTAMGETDKLELENFKVTKSTSTRTSVDEEKLINVLEHMTYHTDNVAGAICVATGLGIVKMKPYVDMDALESAIYNGNITDENLAKIHECFKETEVVTLRVTPVKKKED